jgi:hypothetical protein
VAAVALHDLERLAVAQDAEADVGVCADPRAVGVAQRDRMVGRAWSDPAVADLCVVRLGECPQRPVQRLDEVREVLADGEAQLAGRKATRPARFQVGEVVAIDQVRR